MKLIKAVTVVLTMSLVLTACGPTYKRDTMKDSIIKLAKEDYQLDVEVQESGETIGVRFQVENIIDELLSSGRRLDHLLMVLSRVALSSDRPPQFVVLDVVDETHPGLHMIFTQYVLDIRKLMASALSRTQYFDRTVIEFEINGKRSIFDPEETDLVRLMMTASESFGRDDMDGVPFKLVEVNYEDFLSKVATKRVRRLFKEKKEVPSVVVRDVDGLFLNKRTDESAFRVSLDLASKPALSILRSKIEADVLPAVALEVGRVFKSYKFENFSKIIVVEKNSGALHILARQ